jgi:cold shock protein
MILREEPPRGAAQGLEMQTGTVRWFNLQKGQGYISPDDGGPNIFVAIDALEMAGLSNLSTGQRLVFDVEHDERSGKACAVALSLLSAVKQPQSNAPLSMANPFDALSAAIALAWRASVP